MEFRQIIRERYSCRKFSGTQIAASVLSEILEAGRLAPTAKNLQEQRIYVIQSDDGLRGKVFVTQKGSAVAAANINNTCSPIRW